MRNFSFMLLAAIFGSLLTYAAFRHTLVQQQKNQNASLFQQVSNTNATSAFMPAISTAFGAAPATDFTVAAAKTTPAVVHIKSKQTAYTTSNRGSDPFQGLFGDDFFSPFFGNPGGSRQPAEATGSGVIISNNGYIVTNNHVVENADEIEITLYDNRTFNATVVGTDPNTDIALIKIEAADLPMLELANSDDARVGEWVLAVGNPFNLASTVTAGIVSAKGRNIDILQTNSAIESFIQTDAAVNPGNSGGALVNIEGQLLGINTAIATPTGVYAGYSFAVPANIVHKVVEDLKRYGNVQRAYLGVQIRSLDSKSAAELGVNITQGVYVDGVTDNSAAQEADMQQGDVIVAIDGVRVKSVPELQEQVGKHNPGDVINVGVNRKGSNKDLRLRLRNADGNTNIVRKEDVASAAAGQLNSVLGCELKPVNDKLKKEMGISGGLQVTNLGNGKLKQYTDIREGFVITRVDEKDINSYEEFAKILQSKKGRGVLLEGKYPGAKGIYYYGFAM
ncbi:MAG: Do family serine endopeptidase [Sphingobacteriales bacterium]|nr:Do family serine endopeptidase [Sphingobacteriales bacterium]